MTNVLDGLLGRVEDPNLRAALQAEVDRLRSTTDFGLVFEKHMPENVRLYSHPVRRGLRVEERSGEADSTWLVRRVRDGKATLVDADGQECERDVEELVVVRQFGEPIYPGLKSVGRIERGGDKPFHTVINGENYHALETLLYAYEGKVDCIYIDPPYNTGAKDWTYNNNYVDDNDAYRHSKWLSFMERRLQMARRLLAPNGVLVATIDEHEVQNFGLLLRQTFKDARIQMVTIVMNTAGSMSPGLFSRSDEYAYFCFFGDAAPCKMETDLLAESKPVAQHWFPLFRSRGLNDRPSKRPNLVYPIEVDRETKRIVGAGPSLKDRLDAGESLGDLDAWRPPVNDTMNGNPVVWPILDSGEVTTWQVSPSGLTQLVANGYVRVRDPKQPGPRPFTLSYIKSGTQKQVESGDLSVEGHDESGAVILSGGARTTIPKRTWKVASHDARLYGTTMLRSLLGTTAFTYPKSPYAVLDTLKSIVGDNPDALIVDFFAGSGTTLQAVAILNRLDEGQRRCVLVTNNEVPNDAAGGLREKGLRPGDSEWEANGIAQAVTMPRVTACLTGRRPDDELVEGDYIDGTPISEGLEESAAFFELTYLDRNDVSRGKSFEAIAPLLWMKVGARGEMIAKQRPTFDAPAGARYAVLFDIDVWPKFLEAIRFRDDLEHVFVVTDSLAMYQQVVAELPAEVETTMLYEDYLRNFEINMGGTL